MTIIQLINSLILSVSNGGNCHAQVKMFDADSGTVSCITGYTYNNDEIEFFADADVENND